MKQIILFLFVIISTQLSGQKKDSLPSEIINFIDNEIALEGASITTIKLRKLQQYKKNKIIILDARSFEDFRANRIKGARRVGAKTRNFTVKNIWYLSKNKTMVVYSQKGLESKETVKYLREIGFLKTYNLLGGLDDWERRLLPTVSTKNKKL